MVLYKPAANHRVSIDCNISVKRTQTELAKRCLSVIKLTALVKNRFMGKGSVTITDRDLQANVHNTAKK